MRSLKFMAGLILACSFSSCLQVDHFTGVHGQYDNMYFASRTSAPLRPEIAGDQWRMYALLGLVSWNEDQTRFAGDHLGQVASDGQARDIYVTTEMTIVNWLANVGVSFIPFGSLLFTARSTEVAGWSEGAPEAEPAPGT